MLSNNVCRSNPTVSHSLTGSKHGVLPGHPGPVNISESGDSSGAHTPGNSGASAAGLPHHGKANVIKDLRQRYMFPL